ncbi:MAG TPA: arginine N-succinyltransferase, partial [Marinobacter salarius]|nr:arginine N-succinyltransferase [Marinobacter salarius]
MWLVRPAQPGDLNDILDIAGGQGPRMSSTLPKKEDALSTKIDQSTR